MKMAKSIRILWLLLCVGLACLGSLIGGQTADVAYYGIILLTFPLGLIGLAIFTKLPLVYIASITIGYVQWFILFPKLMIWLKRIKSRALLILALLCMATLMALVLEYVFKYQI
ncbi:hypothetical protein CIK05_14610 [Bdellovibrio sp. qaytius]|nr:hypothetical protein CIK05_14610 [Bdellovibrio sp. qaytius]